MDELAFRVCIFKLDFEHLGKVLAEVMRGSTLNATATDRDIALDSSCIDGSRKSFIFRLASADNWHG